MAYRSNIEITRAAKKRPIPEVGEKIGIGSDELRPFGHDKTKVSQPFINSVQDHPDGKLILVPATDPTPRGTPTGFEVPVREIRFASFINAVCGEIMTMTGLPRIPPAENIHLIVDGQKEAQF